MEGFNWDCPQKLCDTYRMCQRWEIMCDIYQNMLEQQLGHLEQMSDWKDTKQKYGVNSAKDIHNKLFKDEKEFNPKMQEEFKEGQKEVQRLNKILLENEEGKYFERGGI